MRRKKYFVNWSNVRTIALVVLISAVVSFFIIDGVCSNPLAHHGKVYDKHYTPPRTWVTLDTHRSGKSTYTTITTHHRPAVYSIKVSSPDGDVSGISVSFDRYERTLVGTEVQYKTYQGYFTGWCWTSSLDENSW